MRSNFDHIAQPTLALSIAPSRLSSSILNRNHSMKLGSNISAVITDGASGLGTVTARCLASNGVRVGIFDLNEEVRKALADELSGVFCKANVTSSGGNMDQHDSTGHLRYAAVGAGTGVGQGWAARSGTVSNTTWTT
jgi:hypothetical protein